MNNILSDKKIDYLINEKKLLPSKFYEKLFNNFVQEKGHEKSDIDIKSENGNLYTIALRRSRLNKKDFSIVLIYKENSDSYVLLRCNGDHYTLHNNKIENERITGYHIHKAT